MEKSVVELKMLGIVCLYCKIYKSFTNQKKNEVP